MLSAVSVTVTPRMSLSRSMSVSISVTMGFRATGRKVPVSDRCVTMACASNWLVSRTVRRA